MTESAAHDEADLFFENAADNPALVEAARKVSGGVGSDEPAPDIPEPEDGPVRLPGGFRRRRVTATGTEVEEVTTAWVRELNGEDEEKIAKVKTKDSYGVQFVNTILEAGVVKLGDDKPSKDDFSALVVGDQQYLLTEIARVTYGDEIGYEQVRCQFCGEDFDVSMSIHDDIPVRRLDSVADADFEVSLSKGRVAEVTLPTVEISALTAKAETDAEVNTLLIANCVQRIRGDKGDVTIAGDLGAARKLGLRDRQAIVNEMGNRMPGPQYNEVKFNHEPGCGREIRLGVTLVDLFRGL